MRYGWVVPLTAVFGTNLLLLRAVELDGDVRGKGAVRLIGRTFMRWDKNHRDEVTS